MLANNEKLVVVINGIDRNESVSWDCLVVPRSLSLGELYAECPTNSNFVFLVLSHPGTRKATIDEIEVFQ